MKKIFINLSNHPSTKWGEKQLSAAKEFGEIEDIPFPQIAPDAKAEEVRNLAAFQAEEIWHRYDCENNKVTIHVMGEMNFVYNFVNEFKFVVPCVASTTKRIVTENPDGSKTATFEFVQFREY